MNLSTSTGSASVRALVFALAIVGLIVGPVSYSSAAIITLVDENSSATFDTSSPSNAFSWVVDGVEQLFQQAFWYRVGNTGPESSVHSLPISVEGTSDTNFDGDVDTLFVRYVGSGFRIEVRYMLDGGLPGSRASDLAEQITISNLSTSTLDFHFFQYVDFDLNGTSFNDEAVFLNANTVRQSEGALSVSETVVLPSPSRREIDFYANTLNSLTDGGPTTLSDTPAIGTVFGPGDVTWAFQWDFTILPGRSVQISKDKQITGIPEPSAVVLLGLAASLGLLPLRKRS
jgi:hypothetical protein